MSGEFDADLEALGVVGAFLVEEEVVGGGFESSLSVLLENGFEVLLVSAGGGVVDEWRQERHEEVANGVESGVEVDGADDGFEDGGGE